MTLSALLSILSDENHYHLDSSKTVAERKLSCLIFIIWLSLDYTQT
jgi:hypothetical protein